MWAGTYRPSARFTALNFTVVCTVIFLIPKKLLTTSQDDIEMMFFFTIYLKKSLFLDISFPTGRKINYNCINVAAFDLFVAIADGVHEVRITSIPRVGNEIRIMGISVNVYFELPFFLRLKIVILFCQNALTFSRSRYFLFIYSCSFG